MEWNDVGKGMPVAANSSSTLQSLVSQYGELNRSQRLNLGHLIEMLDTVTR